MNMDWVNRLKSTDEGKRLLEQERLILEATEGICRLMETESISKSELAMGLGKSPAFVTKLLSGSNNFTLRTLSDVSFVLGKSAHITFATVGDVVRIPSEESLGCEWSSQEFHKAEMRIVSKREQCNPEKAEDPNMLAA